MRVVRFIRYVVFSVLLAIALIAMSFMVFLELFGVVSGWLIWTTILVMLTALGLAMRACPE